MELLMKIQTISSLVLYVGVIAIFLIAAACIMCKVVEKKEEALDAKDVAVPEAAVGRFITKKATPDVHDTLSRKDALRRFENQKLKIELLRSALSEEGGRSH